jgi:hypothetical protein
MNPFPDCFRYQFPRCQIHTLPHCRQKVKNSQTSTLWSIAKAF